MNLNLPMIFSKAGAAVKRIGGTGLLVARKHAPEILIGGGIAGFLLTIGETVVATNKTNDILEQKEARIARFEKIQNDTPDDPNYTPEDLDTDIHTITKQTRWRLVRTWAPVATTAIASGAMVLGGYRVLNGRYVATAATCKALEATLERYRSNVREAYGEEADWNFMNQTKAEEVEAERKARSEGHDKKGKKYRSKYAMIHSQIFDEYSDHWQRYWTPRQVWEYLKRKEQELNDKLQINKHLFVNEVWDALGLERTPEGQLAGWILTRNNPNSRVSLGLDEMPDEAVRDFMERAHTNQDIWIRLHLNPDGLIYEMIDKKHNDYDSAD